MFPFKWDYKKKGKKLEELSFSERVDFDRFNELMGDDWKVNKFKINEEVDYNEYVYFYENARKALYNTEQEENKIVKYYEHQNTDGGKYIINVLKEESIELKEYKAELKDNILYLS